MLRAIRTIRLWPCAITSPKLDYFTKYCCLHWREKKNPNNFLNQPAPNRVLTLNFCLRGVLLQRVPPGAPPLQGCLQSRWNCAGSARRRCGAASGGSAARSCCTRCRAPINSQTQSLNNSSPATWSLFCIQLRNGIEIAISKWLCEGRNLRSVCG